MAQVFLRNYFFLYFIFFFFLFFNVLPLFNEAFCTFFTTMQHANEWVQYMKLIGNQSFLDMVLSIFYFVFIYIYIHPCVENVANFPNLTTHHRKEKLAHKQEIFPSSVLLTFLRFSGFFLYKFQKYASYPPDS